MIVEASKNLEAASLEITLNDMFDATSEEEGELEWRHRQTAVSIRVRGALMTLLTTARSYHDARNSIIGNSSTLNGVSSGIEQGFKELYDTSFSYRLMEALRNFAQHRTLSVFLSIRSTKEFLKGSPEPSAIRLRKVLTTALKIDGLRKDQNFKRSVMNELDAVESTHLDLRALSRAYVVALTKGHLRLRELTANAFDESVAEIDRAHSDFVAAVSPESGHGTQTLSLYCERQLDRTDFLFIGRSIADHLGKKRKQWARLLHLEKTYVSSQLVTANDTYHGDTENIYIPD